MSSPLPWIKVYGDLPTHRKSVTLAALTGQPRAWTHVVELWLWASRHAPDGDLSKMPPAAIAVVAGWRDDGAAFVKALQDAGFLDGLHLYAWMEHNGAHHRKQAADKVRNSRPTGDTQVNKNVLTSESLVSHQQLGSVESIEYREENKDKNLALFGDRKDASEQATATVEPPADTPAKPRRGRPPKDRSPEAEAERQQERADADRWIAAARDLLGLTAEQAPWSNDTFMAFRQARKKRGVEQLMAAIEGLRGDSFATGLGVRGLLSANMIERGLVKQTKREGRIGLGIESTWEKYFAQHGGQNDQ